jgi:hypothetical protein
MNSNTSLTNDLIHLIRNNDDGIKNNELALVMIDDRINVLDRTLRQMKDCDSMYTPKYAAKFDEFNTFLKLRSVVAKTDQALNNKTPVKL